MSSFLVFFLSFERYSLRAPHVHHQSMTDEDRQEINRWFCTQTHENCFFFFSLFFFLLFVPSVSHTHTHIFCVYVNQLTEMHVWFRAHTHTHTHTYARRFVKVVPDRKRCRTTPSANICLYSFLYSSSLYWTAPIGICVNVYIWPRCYECTMKSTPENGLSQGAIPSWCTCSH